MVVDIPCEREVMPELPEVETIRQTLNLKIVGCTVLKVRVNLPKMLRGQSLSYFKKKLGKQIILKVSRRAKYLLLDFGKDILLLHLGMTGQIILLDTKKKNSKIDLTLPDKHTHLVLNLSKNLILYFRDYRQFGCFYILSGSSIARELSRFGPEPLSSEFSWEYFYQQVKRRSTNIKSLLLNQQIVAGLGNIYTDEALFRAEINPATKASTLTLPAVRKLWQAIKLVIKLGIKYRGTSISDYVDPDNKPGEFQKKLKIYGRAGLKCISCKSLIKKGVVAQRGTHWCPECQK